MSWSRTLFTLQLNLVAFCPHKQKFLCTANLTLSFPVSFSWPPTYIIYTQLTVTVSTSVGSLSACESHFLLILSSGQNNTEQNGLLNLTYNMDFKAREEELDI